MTSKTLIRPLLFLMLTFIFLTFSSPTQAGSVPTKHSNSIQNSLDFPVERGKAKKKKRKPKRAKRIRKNKQVKNKKTAKASSILYLSALGLFFVPLTTALILLAVNVFYLVYLGFMYMLIILPPIIFILGLIASILALVTSKKQLSKRQHNTTAILSTIWAVLASLGAVTVIILGLYYATFSLTAFFGFFAIALALITTIVFAIIAASRHFKARNSTTE